jgi:hypothetical protein
MCTGDDVPNRTERHNTAAQATAIAGIWKESIHVDLPITKPPRHEAEAQRIGRGAESQFPLSNVVLLAKDPVA